MGKDDCRLEKSCRPQHGTTVSLPSFALQTTSNQSIVAGNPNLSMTAFLGMQFLGMNVHQVRIAVMAGGRTVSCSPPSTQLCLQNCCTNLLVCVDQLTGILVCSRLVVPSTFCYVYCTHCWSPSLMLSPNHLLRKDPVPSQPSIPVHGPLAIREAELELQVQGLQQIIREREEQLMFESQLLELQVTLCSQQSAFASPGLISRNHVIR